MRHCFFLFLLCLPGSAAFAQQYRGQVYDAASGAPLAGILITDTRSGALWVSDSAGGMAFTAYPGDVMTFTSDRYQPATLTITGGPQTIRIDLMRAPIELAGVEVLSPMTKFKRDSAFNHQFFHKELGYAHYKPDMNFGGGSGGAGVGVGGLVSEAALIISGKRKSARRLEEEMAYLENMQFAYVRYTPQLVAVQTGLPDSAADAFIIRNPIPNDFLRVASELELKMRIREMYRAERAADSVRRR